MFRRHVLAFLSAAALLSVPVGIPGSASSGSGPVPAAYAADASDIDKTTFTFDPNTFSPVQSVYTKGTKGNFEEFANRVSRFLLVAITALATLLIAVAGLRMALAAGSSEEASKGKTMLRFNLAALAIALLSYAIINLVSWIISA